MYMKIGAEVVREMLNSDSSRDGPWPVLYKKVGRHSVGLGRQNIHADKSIPPVGILRHFFKMRILLSLEVLLKQKQIIWGK